MIDLEDYALTRTLDAHEREEAEDALQQAEMLAATLRLVVGTNVLLSEDETRRLVGWCLLITRAVQTLRERGPWTITDTDALRAVERDYR